MKLAAEGRARQRPEPPAPKGQFSSRKPVGGAQGQLAAPQPLLCTASGRVGPQQALLPAHGACASGAPKDKGPNAGASRSSISLCRMHPSSAQIREGRPGRPLLIPGRRWNDAGSLRVGPKAASGTGRPVNRTREPAPSPRARRRLPGSEGGTGSSRPAGGPSTQTPRPGGAARPRPRSTQLLSGVPSAHATPSLSPRAAGTQRGPPHGGPPENRGADRRCRVTTCRGRAASRQQASAGNAIPLRALGRLATGPLGTSRGLIPPARAGPGALSGGTDVGRSGPQCPRLQRRLRDASQAVGSDAAHT